MAVAMSNKQSLRPVDTFLDQTMSQAGSVSASFTAWLRQWTYDQPLITLLLSCQIGYLIARLGRYARH
jgi:hypothetical protein